MMVYRLGKDIHRLRRFEKMLEELDVGNTEGDDQIFRGDPWPYIFLCFVHNGGPLWRGQRQIVEKMILIPPLLNRQPTGVMRWHHNNQDGLARCGRCKTLMWSIDSVWTWMLLEEEFMAYRFCDPQKWNVSVWYCLHCWCLQLVKAML
jgi:hypothetical protein